MKDYIFFRNDHFYTVSCKDDEEAAECGRINEGTTKVERLDGSLVWSVYEEKLKVLSEFGNKLTKDMEDTPFSVDINDLI